MDKKKRLQIKRDENLAEIDDELDGALDSLEKANARIGDLLATIEEEGVVTGGPDEDDTDSAASEAANGDEGSGDAAPPR
jgi:hypothetical protein